MGFERAGELILKYPDVVEPFLTKIWRRLFGYEVNYDNDNHAKLDNYYRMVITPDAVALQEVFGRVNFPNTYMTYKLYNLVSCPRGFANYGLRVLFEEFKKDALEKKNHALLNKLNQKMGATNRLGLEIGRYATLLFGMLSVASSEKEAAKIAEEWSRHLNNQFWEYTTQMPLSNLIFWVASTRGGTLENVTAATWRKAIDILFSPAPLSRIAVVKKQVIEPKSWFSASNKKRLNALNPLVFKRLETAHDEDAFYATYQRLETAVPFTVRQFERAEANDQLSKILSRLEDELGIKKEKTPKASADGVKSLYEFTVKLMNEQRIRFTSPYYEKLVVIQKGGRRSIIERKSYQIEDTKDLNFVDRKYGMDSSKNPRQVDYLLYGNIDLTKEDIQSSELLQIFHFEPYGPAYEYRYPRPIQVPKGQLSELESVWMMKTPVKLEQWVEPTRGRSTKQVFVRTIEYNEAPKNWPHITEKP